MITFVLVFGLVLVPFALALAAVGFQNYRPIRKK